MAPERRPAAGRLARAPPFSLANTIATDTGWPARLTPHTAIVAQPLRPYLQKAQHVVHRASRSHSLHPPLLLVLTFDSAPPDRRGRSYCCCLYLDPHHLASDSSVHVLLACLRMRLPSPLYEYHPSLRWFVASLLSAFFMRRRTAIRPFAPFLLPLQVFRNCSSGFTQPNRSSESII